MPNYYKILPKNYYIYHFRHQTVHVCRVTVNYEFFSLFTYLLNIDIDIDIDIAIFSKYRTDIVRNRISDIDPSLVVIRTVIKVGSSEKLHVAEKEMCHSHRANRLAAFKHRQLSFQVA